MKMIPALISNEAILGRVVKVDLHHQEIPEGGKRVVSRPRVTLSLDARCLMPLGKELYWTGEPTKSFTLLGSEAGSRGDWRVSLRFDSSRWGSFPERDEKVVMSVHHTRGDPPLQLPKSPPWTHTRPEVESAQIEDAHDARGWE